MSIKFVKRIALASSFILSLLPVHAAVVDDFTGYAGSLFGQNGGSSSGGISWTSSWFDQGFGTSFGINGSSMGSGGTVSSASPYAEFDLNGSNNGESTRTFTARSGTVTYVSFLMEMGTGAGLASSFGGVGLYEGGTEKFLLGEPFSFTTWGAATANLNGASGGSLVSIVNGDTDLLLAKIDQNNNTLDFWVNPDFDLLESTQAPAFTLNYGTNDDDFDTIRLRAGANGVNGNSFRFDNITISASTPFAQIPEPSTFGLLLVGMSLISRLRSKARNRVC